MITSLFLRARSALLTPIARALIGTPPLRALLARARSRPVEGERLDAEIAAMLRLDDALHETDPTRHAPVVARARAALALAAMEAPPPAGVSARDEVLGGRPARLYVPEGVASPSPGLVYLHGGGWVIGDLDTHDAFCRRLAALGRLRVVAVDYRLAPEHPFPAAVVDARAAFREAHARAGQLGIDAARLGIGGDSAGGNLAVAVARDARGQRHAPALCALICPALDGTLSAPSATTFADGYLLTRPTMDWFLDHYAPGDARRHPDVSPLLAEDHAGLPRTLVYTAHFDPLRDDGERYAAKLATAGVAVSLRRFATLPHWFMLLGGISGEALAAAEEIARDVGTLLADLQAMTNDKNDNVTKKPQTQPESGKKVPDQFESEDARKAVEKGDHPVKREQDETGSKAPGLK